MKRIASVLLALSLLLSLGLTNALAAEEKVTLTYWAPITDATVISSWDDNLSWQLVQEATGIDVVFQSPPTGQETEQFNLLIASRELPDIIEYNWSAYAGGVQKAFDDGVIIPLNDYIDQYAPNYKALFENNPEMSKQVRTDDGQIPVFAAFSISDYNCMSGFMIRQDWLEELGLNTPVTLAQWEETLLQLMEKKDLVCGMAVSLENFFQFASGVWGIDNDYYIDNGVVKYGPATDAYLDALTAMKRWYDEGILDADAAAMDTKTMESFMINDEAAACAGFAGGNMGNIYTAREVAQKPINLVGVTYPVAEEGQKNLFANISWEYRGSGSAAITTSCKNIEAACRLLDYFYSDEGRIVKSFGVEGQTFEYVDGQPMYTDLIRHNPDGLSMSQAMVKYLRANSPWVGYIETGYHEGYFARDVQKQAAKNWNAYAQDSKATKLPMLSLTTEEAAEMATMKSLINDYYKEMFVKFVMGQEPLENFESYRAQLENLGLSCTLEIYQAAYERYQSR